jgi:protein-L-isoaspartate(D-aspartate) O-methyltransferase
MNFEAAREQMIEQQVHTWDVFDDRVLAAMRSVPREHFTPPVYREVAFADAPIPLPHGQWMLPAKIHGRILQSLQIQPADVVLEVGSGSGYLTACLGRLAARVQSLELFEDLAQLARQSLLQTAVNNVVVDTADGMRLDQEATYDAIAVTGSLPLYDERFQRALRKGGRLFVVVGQAPIMEAWLVTRMGEREWHRESVFETCIEPLVNAPRPSPFVF